MFAQTGRKFLVSPLRIAKTVWPITLLIYAEYELLIPNIVSHYIVLSDLKDDTLPNRNTDTERSKFVYNDGFRIVESE